jgi:hypothetical protein
MVKIAGSEYRSISPDYCIDPRIRIQIHTKRSWIRKTGRHESMLCAGKGSKTLPYTHILDLAEDGFIKPHVDSARVGLGGLLNIFLKLAVLQIQSALDLKVYSDLGFFN